VFDTPPVCKVHKVEPSVPKVRKVNEYQQNNDLTLRTL